MENNPRYFTIISSVFVATLLISNTVAAKLFSIGPLVFTGAILLFPISYIFGDILTEVYGYAKTRKIIWTGFFCLLLMSFIYWIVGVLPPAPGWNFQSSYLNILGIVPRIAFASIIGFWAGEFSNSFVLSKLKILTQGRRLWTRTIGSTLVGQFVDSILFVFIGFYGAMPISTLILAVLSGYLFKVIYEIIATPITYRVVKFLKRRENIDSFDYGINYNPFVK